MLTINAAVNLMQLGYTLWQICTKQTYTVKLGPQYSDLIKQVAALMDLFLYK